MGKGYMSKELWEHREGAVPSPRWWSRAMEPCWAEVWRLNKNLSGGKSEKGIPNRKVSMYKSTKCFNLTITHTLAVFHGVARFHWEKRGGHSFIHWTPILSIRHVPGTVLGAGVRALRRTDSDLRSWSLQRNSTYLFPPPHSLPSSMLILN